MLASALWLSGCDTGDDSKRVVGLGQIWAYSTTSTSAVTADYRRLLELDEYIPTCPPASTVGSNCRYSRCLYSPEDLYPPQSAGTIALSGGLEDVVVEPNDDNEYLVERDAPLFLGGEDMTFEIGGDEGIPEASLTLRAPTFVTVTDPPLGDPADAEEPLALNRDDDLVVTWTPVPDSTVRVSVAVRQTFEDSDKIQDIALSCRFDAFLGTGMLTKENLQGIPATTDPEAAYIWVGTETLGQTASGRWEHWFGLSAYESRNLTIE